MACEIGSEQTVGRSEDGEQKRQAAAARCTGTLAAAEAWACPEIRSDGMAGMQCVSEVEDHVKRQMLYKIDYCFTLMALNW